MEEARGGDFTWKELKQNFTRDFSFSSVEGCVKEAIEEIKNFIEPMSIDTLTKGQLLELTCINITTKLIILST